MPWTIRVIILKDSAGRTYPHTASSSSNESVVGCWSTKVTRTPCVDLGP